jgi:hypothetical protein
VASIPQIIKNAKKKNPAKKLAGRGVQNEDQAISLRAAQVGDSQHEIHETCLSHNFLGPQRKLSRVGPLSKLLRCL